MEGFGRKGGLIGEPDINKWTFTGLKDKLGVTSGLSSFPIRKTFIIFSERSLGDHDEVWR